MPYGEESYGGPETKQSAGTPKSEGEVWLRIFCATLAGAAQSGSSFDYMTKWAAKAANSGLEEYQKHFTTVYP